MLESSNTTCACQSYPGTTTIQGYTLYETTLVLREAEKLTTRSTLSQGGKSITVVWHSWSVFTLVMQVHG